MMKKLILFLMCLWAVSLSSKAEIMEVTVMYQAKKPDGTPTQGLTYIQTKDTVDHYFSLNEMDEVAEVAISAVRERIHAIGEQTWGRVRVSQYNDKGRTLEERWYKFEDNKIYYY